MLPYPCADTPNVEDSRFALCEVLPLTSLTVLEVVQPIFENTTEVFDLDKLTIGLT